MEYPFNRILNAGPGRDDIPQHRRTGRMDGMSGRLELLDQRLRRAPHALLPPARDDQRVGMVERPFRDLLAGGERHVHVRTRRERHRLDLLSQRATSLDPDLLLRRGYSITLKNGHTVRSASDLQPGDIIETRLAGGSVSSEVKESHPNS